MLELTLRQLEYFVSIAEEGSITRAALRCHLSQAGISLALKEMEAAMNVDLVIRRKSRGIHLTPVGRAVALRAKAILDDIRRLAGPSEDNVLTGGQYTVGCVTTLSEMILPEVAEFFAVTHPQVDLQIIEDDAPELQERMLRGQIDLTFVNEAQAHPEVEVQTIRERPYRVALARDHPLAAGEEVSLRELEPFPAAMLNVRPASYLNEALFRGLGLTPNIKYRSTSVHAVRAIVGRGLAYALLMEPVDASSEGRPLTFLKARELTTTNSVTAALPRATRPLPLSSQLIKHCRQTLGGEVSTRTKPPIAD
jgi:DNA-binding transcriptional LysR family regulator